ncbi:ataxin-1-like protein [Labeo rohita]|uniref:Ataxin-1-like protein n=2 Tax=Labeo rohita TaxID=84645 RepID=A0A498LYI5_LABRO|nr:ataxin-1 [Labeo rohita]XP_050987864.1 ataxin-1 [Labeo rohita]XP_050987865.1 ataxin-1 [Labeo rohita]KAI2655234.1 Ataxin-1 [Labeo rohita]RXN10227.1 ataxin-1-like protein [Labeo rohita]
MKSNQERCNECLPPKKREILALEEKQVLVSAAVSESQSGENLAWLASVATMASMAHIPNNAGPSQSNSAEPDSPPPSNKALTVVTEYPPATTSAGFSFSSNSSTYRGVFSGPTVLTANPAVLSTSLPQTIGSVQYTQLPPNLQLIGPYTSYISSQIVPSTTSPTQPRRTPQEVLATTAVISQASSLDSQNHHVISSIPNVSHSQCIQVESAPLGLTVSSPSAQLPIQIHPHSAVLAPHALALTPSQVVLHYTDGFIAKQPDSHPREMQNGTLGEIAVVKHSTAKGISSQSEGDHSHKQNHNLGLQTQAQVLLPADYSTHDRTGLQTSLMLVSSSHLAANSNSELQSILGKDHSSLHLAERGGICIGKPMSRVSALSSSDSQVSPASTISPHTLLQAPHNTPQQELSTSLYSATQLPIIGYITSASGGPQQAVTGYQSNLPQHVVISGNPSLLIPVSATNINPTTAEPEVTRCSVIPSVANASTALPQTFINTSPPAAAASVLPNGKDITVSDGGPASCVVPSPTQIQLPVLSASVVGSPVPVTPPTSTSPQSSPSSPSAGLPPFFMKGSIIQLADGELKRVEDLRTEDFVQSAEVSGELKIDSSTVERIECSRTPNAVIIQFSVGENKAQVCVEVLVEYPFFVFGQGWSSCCPDRTTQLLALSCAKLSVGDVCISLTLKSLKDSIQKKDYFSDSVTKHNHSLKPAKNNGPIEERPTQLEDLKKGHKMTSGVENSAGTLVETSNPRNVLTLLENGGINPQTQVNLQNQAEKTYTLSVERAVSRKRRWSAPERGEMRSQEDPQVLPKFSFLPHQLKVSIEGRSSTGC